MTDLTLWLYSSGDLESNKNVDTVTIAKAQWVKNIAFVSAGEAQRSYLAEAKKRFNHYLEAKIEHFDPLKKWDDKKLKSLLESDLIYFSGGNTYQLYQGLKNQSLPLHRGAFWKSFDKKRILAGHSAGAIVMTPSLITAGRPHWDRDDNDTDLRDGEPSMGLFGSWIFPHYHKGKKLDKALKSLKKDIFTIADGSAIVFQKGKINILGNVKKINGDK